MTGWMEVIKLSIILLQNNNIIECTITYWYKFLSTKKYMELGLNDIIMTSWALSCYAKIVQTVMLSGWRGPGSSGGSGPVSGQDGINKTYLRSTLICFADSCSYTGLFVPISNTAINPKCGEFTHHLTKFHKEF